MSRLTAIVFAVFAWVLFAQGPAFAQVFSQDGAPSRTVSVPKNKSVAFRLTSNAAEVVVAQPEIAQIVANTDRSVYLRGMNMGSTNVLVYDRGHRLVEVIDVNVGFDAAAVQSEIDRALPGERIIVTGLGEAGLLLSGQATTSTVANRARAIAERYAPKLVTSDVFVDGADQVMLEVRIVEANRSALRDFGIGVEASGGLTSFLVNGKVTAAAAGTENSNLYGVATPSGRLAFGGNIGTTSIDVVIDAMEDKGLLRTLARPNLAAVSGEEASFLAGGEFPFPVPGGDNGVSIEFKPFGVQLKFTPTVGNNGLIRLKVAPEVSQLDNSQPLRIAGFDVPSMTIRRTSTTVELKEGETFAIAGLFQQEYANGIRQIPGLGDVPVLGALFRSTRWRRRETELVVLVTPRLVNAAQSRAMSPDPLRVNSEPSAIDLILSGINLDQPLAAPVGGLRGPLP